MESPAGAVVQAQILSQAYWLLLFYGVSAAALVAMNYPVWLRARRAPLVIAYLAVQACVLLRIVGNMLGVVSPDAPVKWYLLLLHGTGVGLHGVAFLAFALTFATGKPPGLRVLLPAALPMAFFLVAFPLHPAHANHHLPYNSLAVSFGPLYLALQLYFYVLVVAGVIVCLVNFRQIQSRHRGGIALFLAAVLLPQAANAVFLLARDRFPFDPTPAVFTVALFAFSFAIFRSGFLDIAPAARREALRHSPEALLLLDSRGRAAAWNERFRTLLAAGRLRPSVETGPLERYLGRLSDDAGRGGGVSRIRSWRSAGGGGRGAREERVVQTAGGEYFRLTVEPAGAGGRRATVLRAIDVTPQRRLLRELEDRRLDLEQATARLAAQAAMAGEVAVTRARNELARDIHDILGHSLVLAVATLETARMSAREDPDAAARARRSTARILEQCLADIDESLQRRVSAGANTALVSSLNRLVDDARSAGVEVTLDVQGLERPLRASQADAVFRLFQEAVTNSLRHGRATRVGLFLRYMVSGCEMYVIDNGRGASPVVKGFGLSAMEKRIGAAGGELRLVSDGVSGFIVRAYVPYGSSSQKPVVQREHDDVRAVLEPGSGEHP
jgi:signal transduction histidine kinase